jgi:hypothetical protein
MVPAEATSYNNVRLVFAYNLLRTLGCKSYLVTINQTWAHGGLNLAARAGMREFLEVWLHYGIIITIIITSFKRAIGLLATAFPISHLTLHRSCSTMHHMYYHIVLIKSIKFFVHTPG